MSLINLGELPGDGTGDSRRYAGQKINVFMQCVVKSRVLTAPPGSPSENDRYIVAAGATGTWAGHETKIAAWHNPIWVDGAWDTNGGWDFYTAQPGFIAYDLNAEEFIGFSGGVWSLVTPTQNIPDSDSLAEGVTNLFMTAAQVAKLDGIDAGAEVNPTDPELFGILQAQMPIMSGPEITAATETLARMTSPATLKTFIDEHAASGSGSGFILQRLSTLYTTQTATGGVTNATWVDTGLELAITPTAADSTVKVSGFIMCQNYYADAGNNAMMLRLVRNDGTNVTVADGFGLGMAGNGTEKFTPNSAFLVIDNPATTSEITYKVMAKALSTTTTMYVNRHYSNTTDKFCSSLILEEISA